MIEDELRAAFARHEADTPATGPVRDKIKLAFVRRKRRRTAARAAGADVAVLVAAGVVPVALAERRASAPVVQQQLLTGSPPVRTGALNVLLLGTDSGLGAQGERADTVMIVHVPADRSRTFLISLPRDARVPIPGHGTDKLNSSLYYGGAALSRRVVTEVTGLAIDSTVVVDTTALATITDAVGGVDVCLDQAFTSTHNGKHYRAGCQEMKGSDVVPVLRARRQLVKGANDRDRNGQRYLAALAAKLASSKFRTDPAELSSLLSLVSKGGLTVDGSTGDLVSVAAAMRSTVVVGISEPRVTSGIYPTVGRSLFAATRTDDLAQWVTANPSYVLKR